MIETDRLILRPYRAADRADFAALNADTDVGRWVAGALDRAQSDALMDRIGAQIAEHGFGMWGLALKSDDRIIGFCGLQHVAAGALPVGPAIEMGWRIISSAQGKGLATEAARAALAWGFAHIDAPEIIAFTAESNARSQGVMRKIGMTADPSRDFDHPRLAEDHPLRRHVVYAARRPI